jgi:hypothetical protein
LLDLWAKYPDTFKWLGEINVFKHGLAGNAFFTDFTGPRLTVRVVSGERALIASDDFTGPRLTVRVVSGERALIASDGRWVRLDCVRWRRECL